jgi:hypothetical protein
MELLHVFAVPAWLASSYLSMRPARDPVRVGARTLAAADVADVAGGDAFAQAVGDRAASEGIPSGEIHRRTIIHMSFLITIPSVKSGSHWYY